MCSGVRSLPKTQGAYYPLADRGISSGRLLLDTKVVAQELLFKERTYTLTDLAASQLKRSSLILIHIHHSVIFIFVLPRAG